MVTMHRTWDYDFARDTLVARPIVARFGGDEA
jgi:hypothetical protein